MRINWDNIRLGIGIALAVLAIASTPVLLLAGVVFGILAGCFLHPFISEPMARFMASFFWPDRCSKGRICKDYSHARSLLAQHEYDAACNELRQELELEPEPIEVWLLLAETLYDKLRRPTDALAVISRRLADYPWQPEHEQLVQLGVDIHLQAGDQTGAIHLLQEARRRAGAKPVSSRLLERLKHLEGSRT